MAQRWHRSGIPIVLSVIFSPTERNKQMKHARRFHAYTRYTSLCNRGNARSARLKDAQCKVVSVSLLDCRSIVGRRVTRVFRNRIRIRDSLISGIHWDIGHCETLARPRMKSERIETRLKTRKSTSRKLSFISSPPCPLVRRLKRYNG